MKETYESDVEAVRASLRRRLPGLMAAVLSSYDAFTGGDAPLEAKALTAHHGAAKAALSHFEALCKLDQWAASSLPEDDRDESDVQRLIGDARAALSLVADETR